MNEYEIIDKVSSMNIIQKSSIYFDYVIDMIALKHNFEVVYLDRFLLKSTPAENKNLSPYHGWGKPYKEIGRMAFYNLHKDINIRSYEDFCAESNVIVHKQNNWQKNGYASESWVSFNVDSIYHYLNKTT